MTVHVPLRWQLLDEYTAGYGVHGRVIASCADVQGLFADPPPPRYEYYTLLACRPAGRLLAAVGRARGQAWLGDIVVRSRHDWPPPTGCDCATMGAGCSEELLDVTLLRWRPSSHGGGLIDVELHGLVRAGFLRDTGRSLAQRPQAIGFQLGDAGADLGQCLDIAGLFGQRPEPPRVPAVLLGCRPEPPLQAMLDAVATGRPADPPRVTATLLATRADGTAATAPLQRIFAAVTGVRPSAAGDDLVDVLLDQPVTEPFPLRAREIWDLWHAGGPTRPNQWAGYDRALRHEWALAAMAHRRRIPDRPAGHAYHLDGRFVTDLDGFYCAIGETVNGPGGFFGCNLDALHDCLIDRHRAESPFRLVWHGSQVAMRSLIPGYDRQRWARAVTMDDLLSVFADHHIEVDLR